VDPSDEHTITQQVSLGHGQKVKILLEHPKVNVYVKRNKMNLLEWSAYLNRPTVVQVLLEDKRIDPKCNECNAFRIAARKGYYQIVELFLKDLRIDPSGYNNEAIVAAAKAKQGSCETIQVLLRDIRVDPNAQDNIAILNAAKKGHLKMVQTLVASDRVNAAGLKAAYATANCYSHPKVAQFLAKKLRL
jgi:ankyrin repeat protein